MKTRSYEEDDAFLKLRDVQRRYLHFPLRIPDRFSNPSPELPFVIMESRRNCYADIIRPFRSFATREEAINGLEEAIDASFAFAESHHGIRLENETIDNIDHFIWLFKEPSDVLFSGFYIIRQHFIIQDELPL